MREEGIQENDLRSASGQEDGVSRVRGRPVLDCHGISSEQGGEFQGGIFFKALLVSRLGTHVPYPTSQKFRVYRVNPGVGSPSNGQARAGYLLTDGQSSLVMESE